MGSPHWHKKCLKSKTCTTSILKELRCNFIGQILSPETNILINCISPNSKSANGKAQASKYGGKLTTFVASGKSNNPAIN